MVGTAFINFAKNKVMDASEFMKILEKIPDTSRLKFTLFYMLTNLVSKALWMVFLVRFFDDVEFWPKI